MIKLYFSDYFGVNKQTLYDYGTIDISLVTDLPLFIDPFLLFNSEDKIYRALHDNIIQYLRFLRDKSISKATVTDGELRAWYCFKEVQQNWLGYTVLGNSGSGLGMDFARNLHANLHKIFTTFGDEEITAGSHLEKLCLVKDNIGKDNISDFTTNLIKGFLLDYTEKFAAANIPAHRLRKFTVRRVDFNYTTETWVDKTYTLPVFNDDYVLLSPRNILTKDDTWINREDLVGYFDEIPSAISNEQLRDQVNNYFRSQLPPPTRKKKGPTKKERNKAAVATIHEFPELIDYYIKLKEQRGERATAVSIERVQEIESKVEEAQALTELLQKNSEFLTQPAGSLEEAIKRAEYLKDCIENKDGYKIINDKLAKKPSNEKTVQLLFTMVWYGTRYDFNREPNNGRGPVDGTVSFGALDKSIVEFKLASNSQLRHGIEKQTEVYLKANNTNKKVIVIICYTAKEQETVKALLYELSLTDAKNIIVIDARNDNKPSASKS